jgi:hypothetical protein
MYALGNRARLLRHEKTYKQAVIHAAQTKRDAELLALAMCGAVCWLAGVAPGTAVGVRFALAGLSPSRWNAICGELRAAAQDATNRGNTAHHLAFALLGGIVDSRVIEISRPSVAAQAADFRERALDLAEHLTSVALHLIGPEADGETADARPVAFVPPLQPADQRLEVEAATRA